MSAGTIAHPMIEGFDIPPGYSVTLAVKGRENERMSPPHGNCSQQLPGLSSGINYTLVDCQNMCIQRRIMDACGCVDSRLGTPADVTFTRGLPFCNQLPLDLHKLTPSGEPCDYRDIANVLSCQLVDEEVSVKVNVKVNVSVAADVFSVSLSRNVLIDIDARNIIRMINIKLIII